MLKQLVHLLNQGSRASDIVGLGMPLAQLQPLISLRGFLTRGFSSTRIHEFRSSLQCSGGIGAAGGETVTVTFHDDKDGSDKVVKATIGKSLLEVAHENDVDLEGACEGSLACSTCHVVFEDPAVYAKLKEPDDDENDMLDLAYGLTETSRLGCQVLVSKDLDGVKLRIPGATRNFAVDGFVPKPH